MRHLSDQQILLALEGEAPAESGAHLKDCPQCSARRRDLERALAEFAGIPPCDLPGAVHARAKLKTRLRAAPERHHAWIGAVAALGILAFGMLVSRSLWRGAGVVHAAIVSAPDPRLTPGVTLLVSQPALCAQPNPNNKPVPPALQRKVFAEYGISGAPARAYEVDYLVTPALGGADDIHNLWPHSHSATIWNAQVKDALEDRLHEMVCAGHLELREAQQEIAADWIAAYRKYFHTDQPLAEHAKSRDPGVQ
jgi:hypothetical protein